jgi:Tol biopolymer transport system component
MRKRILFIWLFMALQGFTNLWPLKPSNQRISKNPASAAYLGQTPPGDAPEVFAPGVISLENRFETYPSFSPDGRELYFSVVNAAWSEGRILWSRLENGAWTKPEAAPFSDGRFIHWESSVSPDGKKMFFASNRPPSSGMDIWMVERRPDMSWSAPVRLPDSVNSAAEDGSPCLTNNSTLYFKSLRGDRMGGSWLYRAMVKDGIFTAAESLGAVLKTTSGESEPCMSPDEHFLIFISETRKGGNGGWDLWICFRNTDGSWTEPISMGPEINTAADEYGPRVTPDGKYLFFTRETRGKAMDIFWVSAGIIARLRINASVK